MLTDLAYQEAASALTLDAGLAEYYARHPGLLEAREGSAAAAFFRGHDVAHVVFGCSTTLLDEAAVKMWSFFGTTGGLALLSGYRLPESKTIYAEIPWRAVLPTALRSLGVVPTVLLRCRGMTKRWPWSEHRAYRQMSLHEIRVEFGIRILAS
jgi:hypothetical protein